MALELPNGKKINATWIIAALIFIVSQMVGVIPDLIDIAAGGQTYQLKEAMERQTQVLNRLAELQEQQLLMHAVHQAELNRVFQRQFTDDDAEELERRLKRDIERNK